MNDHSKPSESSLSSLGGLSGARRAAIRARLEKIAPGPWRSDPGYDGGATVAIMRDWRPGREIAAAVQGPDAWIHRVDLNTPDANADFIAHAPDDVRDLLAAVDQITHERDEARANNARSICVFCGTITPFQPDASQEDRVLAMWTHAEGCTERPEHRLAAEVGRLRAELEQAEAALVVLTQRHQEKLDKLVAIAGLVNGYHNDGTTLTAAETLREVAKALGDPWPDKTLGLLGSAVPEDSTR